VIVAVKSLLNISLDFLQEVKCLPILLRHVVLPAKSTQKQVGCELSITSKLHPTWSVHTQ
jgi:hypothetical protein